MCDTDSRAGDMPGAAPCRIHTFGGVEGKFFEHSVDSTDYRRIDVLACDRVALTLTNWTHYLELDAGDDDGDRASVEAVSLDPMAVVAIELQHCRPPALAIGLVMASIRAVGLERCKILI